MRSRVMPSDVFSGGTVVECAVQVIRACNSGMISGCPAGVWYPGVPDPDEVVRELGLDPEAECDEDTWVLLWEHIEDDE